MNKTNQMTDHIRQILLKPYTRRLEPNPEGGFTASILEFPGCFAEGDTADEAINNLDEAAHSWLTVAIANGQSVRDPVSFDGYSGKMALRLPRTLHKQIAQLSEIEGASINQLLVSAISTYVGGKFTQLDMERLMPAGIHQLLAVNISATLIDCGMLRMPLTPMYPLPPGSVVKGILEHQHAPRYIIDNAPNVPGLKSLAEFAPVTPSAGASYA